LLRNELESYSLAIDDFIREDNQQLNGLDEAATSGDA
jgi:hypothetical protein